MRIAAFITTLLVVYVGLVHDLGQQNSTSNRVPDASGVGMHGTNSLVAASEEPSIQGSHRPDAHFLGYLQELLGALCLAAAHKIKHEGSWGQFIGDRERTVARLEGLAHAMIVAGLITLIVLCFSHG